MEFPSGAGVPVIGIPGFALFAVQVGMDGHCLRGLQLVDQFVGLRPVALGIPPEGSKRS